MNPLNFIVLLTLTISNIALAKITKETIEVPGVKNDGSKTKMLAVARDGKNILQTMERLDASGVPTHRDHSLFVSGHRLVVLEDDNADGNLSGVFLLNPETEEMEYFYVKDNEHFIPASNEELESASSMAKEVAELIVGAVNGEEVTTEEIHSLRFKIWIRKWDLPMILIVLVVGALAFMIGRRTTRTNA